MPVMWGPQLRLEEGHGAGLLWVVAVLGLRNLQGRLGQLPPVVPLGSSLLVRTRAWPATVGKMTRSCGRSTLQWGAAQRGGPWAPHPDLGDTEELS